MRGIDIFCTSQAATAIGLSSMEDPSSSSSSLSFPSLSSSSTGHLGSSRLIDRHNPIITDPKRVPRSPTFNSPPQSKTAISTPKNDRTSKSKKQKKKSGSSDYGWKSGGAGVRGGAVPCAKGGDFISPAGSTRYLLGERTGLSEALSDLDPVLSLVPGSAPTKTKSEVKKLDDEEADSISTRASSSGSSDQVVVLRVSLHCKGCAGKVRKHISRMPGVTSFSVDFAAKKVTVVGDVTPLEVLASISKVKTAQLWTPPVGPPPPIPSPPQSTLSEAKGYSGLVVTS